MPMTTGRMEPEKATRIRTDVVDDIIWVLAHSSGDVDVTSMVLRLFDASEAEFDATAAMAGERPRMSGDANTDALRAKIERLLFGEVPGDARELDDAP